MPVSVMPAPPTAFAISRPRGNANSQTSPRRANSGLIGKNAGIYQPTVLLVGGNLTAYPALRTALPGICHILETRNLAEAIVQVASQARPIQAAIIDTTEVDIASAGVLQKYRPDMQVIFVRRGIEGRYSDSMSATLQTIRRLFSSQLAG